MSDQRDAPNLLLGLQMFDDEMKVGEMTVNRQEPGRGRGVEGSPCAPLVIGNDAKGLLEIAVEELEHRALGAAGTAMEPEQNRRLASLASDLQVQGAPLDRNPFAYLDRAL